MEFLNLLSILGIAILLFRRPDRERTAFALLVASSLLMVFLFTLATRTGILPGVNY